MLLNGEKQRKGLRFSDESTYISGRAAGALDVPCIMHDTTVLNVRPSHLPVPLSTPFSPSPSFSSFPGHPPSFLSSAIQNFVRPRFRRDHGNANWSVTAITPGRSSRKSVINFSALLLFLPPSTFPFPFQQEKFADQKPIAPTGF